MELRKITKDIFHDKKAIFISLLLGTLMGCLIYFLPDRYSATGSIYVGRLTDNNPNFFTYEGYYGQQTALSYTNSVIGLLQSTDLLKDTLTDLGKPVNEINMWKLKRSLNFKKSGPQTQIIQLSTQGKSIEEAQYVWNAVYTNLENYTFRTSKQSDPALRIYKVTESPTVSKGIKSLGLYIIVGSVVTFAIYIKFKILKLYFKD